MEQQNYEREIDLVQLFMAMWKQVGIIMLAGIVGAVLLGMYKMIPQIQNLNSPEVLKAQQEAYKAEVEAYEERYALAEKEVQNLEVSVERQKEYNENSILMQINPFDVQVAKIQFYVDTNYQINLGMLYQNPDKINSVLEAYASVAKSGILYNYLHKHLKEDVQTRYLKEILTINIDSQNRMIQIEVVHADIKKCDELIQLIERCYREQTEHIEQVIGEHELSVLTDTSYTTVTLDFETSQKDNNIKLEELNKSLEVKKAELANMNEPINQVTSRGNILKSSVKYVLVGGVLGAFVAAAVILFLFMLNTTIKDGKDAEFYLGLPVIAAIPVLKGQENKVKTLKKSRKTRLNQYGER